jgi:hypothetical protein
MSPEPERSGDAPSVVESSAHVSDEQRNGSIAGIALLLGFSLSFTATWSQGDDPWSPRGLFVFAIAAFGIAFQLRALFAIFSVPNIPVEAHRRAASRFLAGVVAVLSAYVLHIAFDAASDLSQP